MEKTQVTAAAALEKEALLRMQKARSELLFSHPFFGSLALKLVLTSDTKCANLWTDGKILAYNPHFISVMSHEHIMASQAHEILHIVCNHHVRRKGRREKLWNKACDYAINGLLLEAGFSLPENLLLYDKTYADKSVDEIYECLCKIQDNQELHGGAQNALTAEQSEKNAEDAKSGDVNATEEGSEAESKDEQAKGTQGNIKDANSDTKASVSSSGDAPADDFKQSSAEQNFFGEIKDHPLLRIDNKENRQKAEEESLIQMAQAIHSAEGHGDVPMGLLRLYKTRIRPTLDWQILLQRFIENCNDGDYSWSMPNKRYISYDIYLPSRKEPRIALIALAIDASGSIDNDTLGMFCSELEKILENFDTNLFVIYHDTKIQKHDYFSRSDRPLRLFVQGGGGTSYKHVPEYIHKENIQPTCLLWFTDLECTFFPEEPNYPVVWLTTKKAQKAPPFGEVLHLFEL